MGALVESIRTMSTREIAELTGKAHAHMLRDADAMLEALDPELKSKFGSYYQREDGRRYRELLIPKRETLILISGYDLHLRAKIIDRWEELEARKAALPDFADPAAAARAWADQHDEIKKLQAKAGARPEKASALAFAKRKGAKGGEVNLAQLGKRAKRIAIARGAQPETVADERWDKVHIFDICDLEDAWRELLQ